MCAEAYSGLTSLAYTVKLKDVLGDIDSDSSDLHGSLPDDSMPKKLASGGRVVHGINYGIF